MEKKIKISDKNMKCEFQIRLGMRF